jgi:DEAD/DEAH box helicase domain-containing protein
VLANLRYVVVDEAHVYRGVFGSHVANVLRGLRRLARAYGSEPQFVLASATIANPAQLGRVAARRPATVVDSDAAPRRADDRALEPELIDAELGVRASALGDASRLLAGFVERGLRTICFAKSRKAVELIHRFTPSGSTPSSRRGSPLPRRLHAVAAPRDRAAADGGELLGVSATDALELGIDIGSLDCAISVGFPARSLAAAAVGPAGRRGPGLAVLVASEDALDQYFMREPETLLAATVEAAILDHANPRVLDGHVLSAAFEGPIDERDARPSAPRRSSAPPCCPELKRTPPAGSGRAPTTRPRACCSARRARLVHGRRRETGTVLGTVERSRAYSTVHEGAIYLHLGEQHLVRILGSRGAHRPSVSRANVDWYTQAKKETQTAIVERSAASGGSGSSSSSAACRDRAGRRVQRKSGERRRHARDGAAATCPRRASRPRPSGSALRPRSSTALRTCRSCSPPSMRPSTR